MSKFWCVVIIGIIVFGLFFYYKPEKTKDITSSSIDKIGSIIKDYIDSREINLGYPQLPCSSDNDCNTYIEKCQNLCKCVEGNCFKNVPANST